MSLLRSYFKHQQAAETILSLIAASLYASLVEEFSLFRLPDPSGVMDIMLGVMGLSASLLGFVLAASTFLISHIQHPRLQLLRRSQGYRQLLRTISASLWKLFALTLSAGALALVHETTLKVASPVFIFLLTSTALSLAALIWATLRILGLPLHEEP